MPLPSAVSAVSAVGVRQNPDPLPDVWRIDGTSRNTDRPDGVAETFQVSTHLVECQIDETRHILAKEPSGPESAKAADHFRPEVTVIALASLLPSKTERLTGESAANKINAGDVSPVDLCNVVMTWDFRPVLFEDFTAPVVIFNLPFDSHPGSFKSKVKPSYAAK